MDDYNDFEIVTVEEIELEDDDIDVNDINSIQDSVQTETDSPEKQDREIFDPSLPTQHSYLGYDMECLSGRTILDDSEYLWLPILSNLAEFKSVVIPGQTIPLAIYDPAELEMVKKVMDKDRTFGIRCSSYARIGTTVEIFEYKNQTNPSHEPLHIKVKGRQRFCVLETEDQLNGIEVGKIQILPEVELSPPLHNIEIKCMKQINKWTPYNLSEGDYLIENIPELKNSCPLTSWPLWIYKQYQPVKLVARIKQHLHEYRMAGQQKMVIPNDPQQLSYWLAANLPLDNRHRLALLSLNCAIQRLRYLLSILERWEMLVCRQCGEQISMHHHLFSMSLEGPQGAYINTSGYVHETLTVKEAKGLQLLGGPSSEYSWFPGYSWNIAQCAACHNHIGWKFQATKANLEPSYFWGLSRRSITVQLTPQQGRPLQPIL